MSAGRHKLAFREVRYVSGMYSGELPKATGRRYEVSPSFFPRNASKFFSGLQQDLQRLFHSCCCSSSSVCVKDETKC